MSTIWLLIAISNGGYNEGTLSSVEFTTQRACISAREQIKEVIGNKNLTTLCVPKGSK